MVRRLEPSLQDSSPAAGVLGGVRQHLGKVPLAYMMRTGACNKDAAGTEQPHCAVVDFFVAAKSAFKAVLASRECRRVENDRVIPSALPMSLAQEVKNVGFDRLYVRDPV